MKKQVNTNGLTDMLILLILDTQDTYSYDILKKITEYSQELININHNNVYGRLYKLENRGFLSSYTKTVGEKRKRKYYHLNHSGKELLKQLIMEYYKITKGIEKVIK